MDDAGVCLFSPDGHTAPTRLRFPFLEFGCPRQRRSPLGSPPEAVAGRDDNPENRAAGRLQVEAKMRLRLTCRFGPRVAQRDGAIE
ncbi:MAG: hypothetical protein ACK4N4_14720, partial [Burkholderiales bacterium]